MGSFVGENLDSYPVQYQCWISVPSFKSFENFAGSAGAGGQGRRNWGGG